jgi:hypothetical protein
MRIRQARRRVRRTAQAHRRTPDQKQAGTCIPARTLSRIARGRGDGPTFSAPTLAGATLLAMSGSDAPAARALGSNCGKRRLNSCGQPWPGKQGSGSPAPFSGRRRHDRPAGQPRCTGGTHRQCKGRACRPRSLPSRAKRRPQAQRPAQRQMQTHSASSPGV